MEVLSSRVLLHPTDFERSLRFYSESLGLPVYPEWGSGSNRGVVFDKPWGLRKMQIRDSDGLRIVIVELPSDHPLRRR